MNGTVAEAIQAAGLRRTRVAVSSQAKWSPDLVLSAPSPPKCAALQRRSWKAR